MMNCQAMEKSLIAYLDGKAHPAERREVETHLGACAECRVRAEQFRSLWGMLDELPLLSPSPAFDAEVRARVTREPRHAVPWMWPIPSPRLAFAVVAMVMLSVWLSSRPPVRQPEVDSVAAVRANGTETEFTMIKDLPALEDYDVLSNFDALSELPVQQAPAPAPSR
jgi:anti-sigma factor RsiW